MKDIREVYQGDYWSDYCIMLDSFGYENVLQVDDDDYQGDSRVLFKDGDRYGILIFGWGSCSGCDALQACETYEQLDELRNNLYNGIIWFDNAKNCLEYFNNHDWKGDYSWHADETKEFLSKSIEYLENKITVQRNNHE